MKYQVLIPTHNKNIDECIALIEALNVRDNVLVCSQNNEIKSYSSGCIQIELTDNIGVSNNRNNLLKYASGDICICIDDDCPLVDNYLEIIESTFKKYPDAEFILFNGIVTHENNRLVHNKKTKRVRRFKDVSYAGGPGLVFKRDAIKKYNLKYDTNVGYPNKIQLGEDTLFIKSIVDSKANFVRSSKILFIIKDDIDNSTYFSGVTKEFIISKGYIMKKIYPRITWIYKYFVAFKIRHWRNNQFKISEMIKLFNKGIKEAKN